VRYFKNNSTPLLKKLLEDNREYAPHATKKEPDTISAWIVFVEDRKNRLEAAWNVRVEQEAKNKKSKK
jgi:hypothetical protein